jgi:hypothetical protein
MGGYATLSGQGGRTGKDTENASASQPGHCCLVGEDRVKTGAQHKKTPLPVTQHSEGVCQHTRRLALYPHGALKSREAYPLQRSSLQGLLPHKSSYQEALGLHTYD